MLYCKACERLVVDEDAVPELDWPHGACPCCEEELVNLPEDQ